MTRFMSAMCLIGILAGCAPPAPQFIVYRDVPESPSFVVIPANNYSHQVQFANEIEEAIISCGVKVIIRPSTRQITTEQSIGGRQGARVRDPDTAVASIQEADAKRVESYSAYENIDADYFVQTNVSKRHVKISKRDTREILAVFYANSYRKGIDKLSWKYQVYETLKHMGIQVRNPFPGASRP